MQKRSGLQHCFNKFQKMKRRNFIKNITLGSVTLSGLSKGLNNSASDYHKNLQ
jgi:hypothetical protein